MNTWGRRFSGRRGECKRRAMSLRKGLDKDFFLPRLLFFVVCAPLAMEKIGSENPPPQGGVCYPITRVFGTRMERSSPSVCRENFANTP